jgi:hypothetical protein
LATPMTSRYGRPANRKRTAAASARVRQVERGTRVVAQSTASRICRILSIAPEGAREGGAGPAEWPATLYIRRNGTTRHTGRAAASSIHALVKRTALCHMVATRVRFYDRRGEAGFDIALRESTAIKLLFGKTRPAASTVIVSVPIENSNDAGLAVRPGAAAARKTGNDIRQYPKRQGTGYKRFVAPSIASGRCPEPACTFSRYPRRLGTRQAKEAA